MRSSSVVKSSFGAVADARTLVLVLGSLPGEMSLARAQYYGNPRNQFWWLMEAVTGVELVALPYEARLESLLLAGVGLWDVIRSARRSGSLDAAIRQYEPNALADLAARLPSLRAVAFNGGAAAKIGGKLLAGMPGLALIALPSSSPAHTAALEVKHAAWLQLAAFL